MKNSHIIILLLKFSVEHTADSAYQSPCVVMFKHMFTLHVQRLEAVVTPRGGKAALSLVLDWSIFGPLFKVHPST